MIPEYLYANFGSVSTNQTNFNIKYKSEIALIDDLFHNSLKLKETF